MYSNFSVFLILIYNTFASGQLCVRQNASCSYQIGNNVHENSCQMIYYRLNSSECYIKHFNSTSEIQSDFGLVQLKPFTRDSRTVFNITMQRIKWKRIHWKFEQINGIESKCSSRDLILNKPIPKDKILYYDCPWSDASYEGQEVNFLYEYGIDNDSTTRNYVFNVPKHEHISNESFIFLYVDVTDLYNLELRIQPVVIQDGLYEVNVYRTRNNKNDYLDTRLISSNDKKDEELSFMYQTYGEYGDYYFLVKFEDSGMEFRTSSIFISPKYGVLTIGIVGISIIIPLILFVLYMWRKQCLQYKRIQYQNLKILLVPTPLTDYHVTVVTTLKDLLEQSFNINVMLDVVDIPKTSSKDPSIWYKQSFENATHIIFLISNDRFPKREIIYKNIECFAVSLMNLELTKRVSKKEFAVVTFPYSSDISIELRSLKRFKFLSNFNSFFNYLWKRNLCLQFEERINISEDDLFTKLRSDIKIAETYLNELKTENGENEEKCNVEYVTKQSNYNYSLCDNDNSKDENDEKVAILNKIEDLNLFGREDGEEEEVEVEQTGNVKSDRLNVQDLSL